MIGDGLVSFNKADEAIEHKDFSQYARICIMWKPHPLLPHAIEIRMTEGYWWQEIEIEEAISQCKYYKIWGHSEEECKTNKRGKAWVERGPIELNMDPGPL